MDTADLLLNRSSAIHFFSKSSPTPYHACVVSPSSFVALLAQDDVDFDLSIDTTIHWLVGPFSCF